MAVRGAARHFESAAAGYARFRNVGPLGLLRREEQRALHEFADVRPGDRVLDAGCGDGETMSWLHARGAKPFGVDLTHSMAATCRDRGFPVAVQDMEHLGVRSVFDWALCIGSLEFTEQPGKALAELSASLRAAGKLVLLFPRRTWFGRLYAFYHRAHGVSIKLFTHAEISAYFRTAGLREPSQWRDCALSTVCVTRRSNVNSASPTSAIDLRLAD
jgi:SAM-dependent methyltransferase